nr:hypothetical protein [Tanacetum cinerariifolium]
QRSPQNCTKCGNPVKGHYCQGCAVLRQTFKKDLFASAIKHGIIQNSSEPSNDNSNVVNAPREPFIVNQDPAPQINHHCCYECGDPLKGIFCHQFTCKLCGNGAHYGYNCPPKVPIIPDPEPFNNQTIKELPLTVQSFDPKPDLVHKSPNVSNPSSQLPFISCEFCGNDARYGHYCTQVPFVYPEPCYNQDFNFPQEFQGFHDFQQQDLCCENSGVTHEAYQCQPKNHGYYHEQNSCYDSNSFGFDQFQPQQYTVNHPVFNAQNKLFDSQNKLMEQLTSMCDIVSQLIQKKEEEKKIEEGQAADARYWKIPACYNDDDDYNFALTPNKPINSLSMGDEHPDTIPATKSDEFIKSSVENLIPIPSESDGIPDNMCDVPFHDNSPPLDASPPDSELVSSKVMEIVIPKVGGIDNDILLTIKDDILREKLLNVNLLIAKIEALNDNPTPSFDFKTKSFSTSLNSFLEETNNFDNSLPEFKTFCFDVEEISSGSTITHSDISLLEYEVFCNNHVKEISSGSTTTHSDYPLYDSSIFDLSINPFPPVDRSDFYEFVDELIHFISPPEYDCFLFKIEPNSRDFTMDVVEDISPTKEPRVHNALPTHPTLQLNMKFQPFSESLFTYVIWTFLPFLVYSVAPQYLLSLRNEDTILIPAYALIVFLGRMYLIGVELSQDSKSCLKVRWRFSLPLAPPWTNEFGVESGSRLG